MPRLAPLGFAFAVLFAGGVARAEPTDASCSRAFPWNRLGESGRNFVRPLPLVLTGASAVPPLALSPTGLDYRIRVWAQRDLGGKYHLEPVSFFTPFVLAGGTLVAHVAGAAVGSCAVQRPTAAMLQALVIGMALTGALKVTTGRAWPNGGRDPTLPDRLDHPEDGRDFRPFRRGLAAFPSGHTLSVMTLAAAFRAAEPELGVLAWVLYPVALGVGAGMWFSDHHWASDVLSGALLGEAIGGSVGQGFSRASDHEGSSTGSGTPFVEPLPGGGALVGFRTAL